MSPHLLSLTIWSLTVFILKIHVLSVLEVALFVRRVAGNGRGGDRRSIRGEREIFNGFGWFKVTGSLLS